MPATGHIRPDKQDIVVSVRIDPKIYAYLVRMMEDHDRRVSNKSDPLKMAVNNYYELAKEHEMAPPVETAEEIVEILEDARIMWKQGTRNHEKLMKNISREEMKRMGGSMKRKSKEDIKREQEMKETAQNIIDKMSTEEKQQNLSGRTPGKDDGPRNTKPASPFAFQDDEDEEKEEKNPSEGKRDQSRPFRGPPKNEG